MQIILIRINAKGIIPIIAYAEPQIVINLISIFNNFLLLKDKIKNINLKNDIIIFSILFLLKLKINFDK